MIVRTPKEGVYGGQMFNQGGTWRTSHGTLIAISEMTDSHIRNTVRQISERAVDMTMRLREVYRNDRYWGDYWENHEIWPQEINPEYNEMEREETRRKL